MVTAEKTSLQSLLAEVTALPSLPSIALRIIEEIKKETANLSDLADIISFDPALTAKILRIANSSFYALPYKVESIEKAVNILGLEALKNIALSFVIVRGFKRDAIDQFDHELFWKRSITAAVSAEMVAIKLGMKREDTFVTPMLMDIGVLVMYLVRPDDYMRVLDEKRVSRMSTVEAEKVVFGFDHQEVGSEILKKWGIPENIHGPIAYHHRGEDCPSDLLGTVDILSLADISSSVYNGSRTTEKFGELKHLLKGKLNISDSEIEGFIDSIAGKTVEILSTFDIEAGDMKPYSQILEEANQELGRLNLSYEQLVMELKQEKIKVEALAGELKIANEKLRTLAFKDSLTNLFNRRFFQELMDKELQRVERYSNVLSFMMIDIDHFKKINDTYGHPCGDAVLRTVAELFEKTIRKPDTAARYGGEEFAIVLPETDIKGALVLAERLRERVEDLEIKAEDKVVRVTISIGVTAYEPGKGKKSVEEVISSADRALYNSKKTGRNKLSIIM